jgi:hypothetical protein
MRLIGIMSLGCLSVLFLPATPSNQKSKTADLQWAKGVALDFLKSASGGAQPSAIALTSPELAKAILAETYPNLLQTRAFAFKDATIISEEASPDGTEVIFKGRLKYAEFLKVEDGKFKLRLVNAHGKWSIRFIDVESAIY